MSRLFEDLRWRGLVHQVSDEALPRVLDQERLTVYVGFDPTADSLHHGNLLQLCTLRRLQQAGHRPIALAGGGTGMIGDPSGKSEERQLLSAEQLEANLSGIRSELGRILDFGEGAGESRAVLADNGEWLWQVGLLEFLRDVGKHFTVNQMIAKESVRARLTEREQGISYTEFSYMLLQAYDFLALHDRYGCRLQMGGSDQWGNIVMGVELIRKVRGAHAYALTTPLVTKADGTKFGKSEIGAVYLSPRRTTPYRFYQYWIRVDDRDVGPFLRFFTFLPRERIEELDASTRDRPERRDAQRALAWEVTAMVHGEHEAARARRASEALFSEDVAGLSEDELLELFAEAPSSTHPRRALDDGSVSLVDALVAGAVTPSRSAARTAVLQGGVYVNNRRDSDPDRRLGPADALHGRYVVLRKGKRDHHLVRFE